MCPRRLPRTSRPPTSEVAARVTPGLHPVRELLRAGAAVDVVHVARGREPTDVLDEISELATSRGVPVRRADGGWLDQLAHGVAHQGVVAEGPAFPYVPVDGLLAGVADVERPLLVALDRITDPHNLGSVARTAEAVGAHGLIVAERRAVGVTPAAEKAAAGALAHLPVAQVTNLVRTIEHLGEQRIWSIGLDADADQDVQGCDLFTEPLVLVVGAEGRGLARLTAERCDLLVSLPMAGHVGSLNAAVATGVTLYEIRRRRSGR